MTVDTDGGYMCSGGRWFLGHEVGSKCLASADSFLRRQARAGRSGGGSLEGGREKGNGGVARVFGLWFRV